MKPESHRAPLPRPFCLTPDPRFFYPSSCHREALDCLEQGIRGGRGLLVLLGAPGLGKTTLLHALAERLGDRILPVFLSSDKVESEREFFHELCLQLSLPCRGKTVEEMEQEIRRFASGRRKKRKTVLLLLDEANEPGERFRQSVARLHAMEKEGKKLIPMILAGPPEHETQTAGQATSFPAAVSPPRCVLKPLDPLEAVRYILHRLLVAGIGPERVFSTAALHRIVLGSQGNPRMINVISGNAMEIAFARQRWPVEESSVREALADLGIHPEKDRAGRWVAREEVAGFYDSALRHVRENAARWKGTPPRKTRRRFPWGVKKASECLPPGKRSRTGREDDSRRDLAPGNKLPGRLPSIGNTGRFLAFFLLVAALLGGGSLVQVLLHKKEIREAKTMMDRQRLGAAEPAGRETPVPGPEEKRLPQDSLSRFFQERKDRIQAEWETIGAPSDSPDAPARTFQDRDLAGIALDHCGTVNREILGEFMRLNPRIRNWNVLDRTVELTLPETGDSACGRAAPVDVFSIFLASYDSRGEAIRAAETLSRAGVQNLFLTTADGEGSRTLRRVHLCAGVFASEASALKSIEPMRGAGFPEARPVRIREPSLGKILHPFRPATPASSP
jgi:type II secretory pathway predicted ATPase ExeA